jgi:hypothetical protein
MTDEKNNERKKPYLKPEAHRFSLRPEEAVLGNCKTSTGHGPNAGTGGGNCRVPGACMVIGS